MATKRKPAKRFQAQVEFTGTFFVDISGTSLEEALEIARKGKFYEDIVPDQAGVEYLDGQITLVWVHEVTDW